LNGNSLSSFLISCFLKRADLAPFSQIKIFDEKRKLKALAKTVNNGLPPFFRKAKEKLKSIKKIDEIKKMVRENR